jgi:outer membrane biosynthesis protein TonB
MKRPVVLIVGAAAGALIVAGVGASAHNAISLATHTGFQSSVSSDEATGARTESPEPSENPEAPPTAEPTEKPEPTETPEPVENEPAETDNDNENENHSTAPSTPTNHEDGGDHHSGDGGGGDD